MDLRESNRFLYGTLLMRAHGERQEIGVDRPLVVRQHDQRSRSRNPFYTNEDPHYFIRSLSGSNSGLLPATATFTGNSSFMYMTWSSVPSTACSGGK